jgi:hypothetical protein
METLPLAKAHLMDLRIHQEDDAFAIAARIPLTN